MKKRMIRMLCVMIMCAMLLCELPISIGASSSGSELSQQEENDIYQADRIVDDPISIQALAYLWDSENYLHHQEVEQKVILDWVAVNLDDESAMEVLKCVMQVSYASCYRKAKEEINKEVGLKILEGLQTFWENGGETFTDLYKGHQEDIIKEVMKSGYIDHKKIMERIRAHNSAIDQGALEANYNEYLNSEFFGNVFTGFEIVGSVVEFADDYLEEVNTIEAIARADIEYIELLNEICNSPVAKPVLKRQAENLLKEYSRSTSKIEAFGKEAVLSVLKCIGEEGIDILAEHLVGPFASLGINLGMLVSNEMFSVEDIVKNQNLVYILDNLAEIMTQESKISFGKYDLYDKQSGNGFDIHEKAELAHDLIYDLTVLVAVRRLGEDSYYDLKSTVYNSKILKLIGCVAPKYHESALSTIDDWHTAYTAFFDQIERVLFVYTALKNEEDAPIESANLTFSNINIPTTTNEWRMMYLDRESTHVHDRGTSFSLKGTITSDNLNIMSVTCQVVNERTGAIPQQKTVQCNTKSFNISSQIDSYIKFAQIPVGHYRLKYTATLSDGTKRTYISDLFAVMEFYDYTRPIFTVTVDADNNLIASWTSSGDYVTHYSIHLYSQNGIVNNPAPVLKKVNGDILSYNLGQFSPGTYELFVIPSTRDTEYGLYSHYYDYGDKIIYKVNVGNSQSSGSGVANVYDYSSEYKTSKWYRQLMEVRLTGNQRQDIVNVARSQIGYHEGNNRSELHGNNASGYNDFTEYAYYMGKHVYNKDLYAPWCAMFVAWCARQADVSTSVISNATYAKAANEGACFQNLTFKKKSEYTPIAGDLVFFNWHDNDLIWDHVGIVSSVKNGQVYFIDGNSTAEAVREYSYPLDSKFINGYGIPAYKNAHVHTPGDDATCTSDQACTTCGAVVNNKLGHSYNTVVTVPTCTTEGYTTHTCTRCGDSYTDTRTSKKGHTPFVVPGVDPTHEMEGLTEGSICKECGEILKPQETVPKQEIVAGSVDAGSGTVFFTINIATGEMSIQSEREGEMGNYVGAYKDRDFIWYKYAQYIKKIVVEEGVTSVGDYAFFGLSSLKEVVLPHGITKIGYAAFSGCSSLVSISIPSTVTMIDEAAFCNCSSLESIVLPDSVEQLNASAFYGCTMLNSVKLSSSLYEIAGYTFYGCTALETIIVPNRIANIGDSAFMGCKGLKQISLPEGLTNIGNDAFNQCESITEILLPDSIVTIGRAAFRNCNNLECITIPSKIKLLDVCTFEECQKLATVIIPEGVDIINHYAFKGCVSLKEIKLPTSLTDIRDGVFEDCINLERISIPDNIQYVSYKTFYNCQNLSEVILSKSIIQINDSAFENCVSLHRILIPESVQKIGSYAFAGCTNISSAQYNGAEEEWSAQVSIGEGNDYLLNTLTFLHTHAYTIQVATEAYLSIPATCTTPSTYYYSCPCGEKGTETFTHGATTPHTEETIPAIPATCTDLGKTEGSKCSVCGEILVKQTIVAPLGHTEIALLAKAATCTEAGLTAGTRCEVCGDTLISQKEIPAKGHAEVIDPAKSPTCTETGLTEGKHCSTCGEVLVAQTEIPAKGHAEVIDPAKPPTCTETGLTEGKYCSTCGEVLVAQTEVPATGHTTGDWITTVEPAIGTEGQKQQSCSVCNKVLNEETIPALPGETEPVTEPVTEPTTEPDSETEPDTPPVTEAPTEEPVTPSETAPATDPDTTEAPDTAAPTDDPMGEPEAPPAATVGCSGSVLSCALLMLIALAGATLVKRKE